MEVNNKYIDNMGNDSANGFDRLETFEDSEEIIKEQQRIDKMASWMENYFDAVEEMDEIL